MAITSPVSAITSPAIRPMVTPFSRPNSRTVWGVISGYFTIPIPSRATSATTNTGSPRSASPMAASTSRGQGSEQTRTVSPSVPGFCTRCIWRGAAIAPVLHERHQAGPVG